MVSGFGMIDYVVVLLTLGLTAYFLATRPERLLLFLPAFLTIDFFIPLGSQLTPSRLVPLMIGVWALVNYETIRKGRYSSWIAAAFAIILISFLYAVICGYTIYYHLVDRVPRRFVMPINFGGPRPAQRRTNPAVRRLSRRG